VPEAERPGKRRPHQQAVENLVQADGLPCGQVIYEMMETAWRPSSPQGMRLPGSIPFARTINAAKKYVVWRTPECVAGNAALLREDLAAAVQQRQQ
jgi:hypothetical protein